MEIIATHTTDEPDYLQAWESELSRCESLDDLTRLWFAHEETLKNDPDVKELFIRRDNELCSSLELARRGYTMSAKQINKAVKQAASNE